MSILIRAFPLTPLHGLAWLIIFFAAGMYIGADQMADASATALYRCMQDKGIYEQ